MEIDRLNGPLYSCAMPSNTPKTTAEMDLKRLEQWVLELLRTCDHLKTENQRLRGENRALQVERDELAEKNTVARNRVEAVISRLKSMENSV